MDPIEKSFHAETAKTPEQWPRFHIGETFVLNGVEMRIRKITNKDIILRPVKK